MCFFLRLLVIWILSFVKYLLKSSHWYSSCFCYYVFIPLLCILVLCDHIFILIMTYFFQLSLIFVLVLAKPQLVIPLSDLSSLVSKKKKTVFNNFVKFHRQFKLKFSSVLIFFFFSPIGVLLAPGQWYAIVTHPPSCYFCLLFMGEILKFPRSSFGVLQCVSWGSCFQCPWLVVVKWIPAGGILIFPYGPPFP